MRPAPPGWQRPRERPAKLGAKFVRLAASGYGERHQAKQPTIAHWRERTHASSLVDLANRGADDNRD